MEMVFLMLELDLMDKSDQMLELMFMDLRLMEHLMEEHLIILIIKIIQDYKQFI